MGWTSCYVIPDEKNKRLQIDRKKACDDLITGKSKDYIWEVLKSSIVNTTYYAAVKQTNLKSGNSVVFGMTILTSTNLKDYFNFSYKEISEDMGPGDCQCPISILNLLDETTNQYALDWRERCYAYHVDKNDVDSLYNLSLGSVIEFETPRKEIKRAVKCPAGFQFSKPYWALEDNSGYISKKRIPSQYKVLKRG